jgi:hypothetical protein
MIRTLNGLGANGSSGSSTNVYINTLENGEAIEIEQVGTTTASKVNLAFKQNTTQASSVANNDLILIADNATGKVVKYVEANLVKQVLTATTPIEINNNVISTTFTKSSTDHLLNKTITSFVGNSLSTIYTPASGGTLALTSQFLTGPNFGTASTPIGSRTFGSYFQPTQISGTTMGLSSNGSTNIVNTTGNETQIASGIVSFRALDSGGVVFEPSLAGGTTTYNGIDVKDNIIKNSLSNGKVNFGSDTQFKSSATNNFNDGNITNLTKINNHNAPPYAFNTGTIALQSDILNGKNYGTTPSSGITTFGADGATTHVKGTSITIETGTGSGNTLQLDGTIVNVDASTFLNLKGSQISFEPKLGTGSVVFGAAANGNYYDIDVKDNIIKNTLTNGNVKFGSDVSITGTLTTTGLINGKNLTTMETNISNNAAAIVVNANGITNNATQITNNLNNININGTAIGVNLNNINTNTADILTNTNAIAGINVSGIANNSINIAANVANILTNTNAIATINNAGYITASSNDTLTNKSISYSQLTSTPTIPTNNTQLLNGKGYITASTADTLTNKSISYSQITSQPTIPTNNTQLSNGAGYITASTADTLTNKSISYSQLTSTPTIPTNNTQLTNGSNFITASTTDTLTNKTIQSCVGNSSSVITFPSSTGTLGLKADIDTNTTAITANTGNISENEGNITTNTNNIATLLNAGYITASSTDTLTNKSLSYSQLTSTPTIPTNNTQLTNGSNFITTSTTDTLTNKTIQSCVGNSSSVITFPSSTGTLALTSDIPSAGGIFNISGSFTSKVATATKCNEYIFSSGVNANGSCRIVLQSDTNNPSGGPDDRNTEILFKKENDLVQGSIGMGRPGTETDDNDMIIDCKTFTNSVLLQTQGTTRLEVGTTEIVASKIIKAPLGISINKSGECITLKGTGAGNANACNISFRDSNDVRKGAIGDGSSSDGDIYVISDAGDIKMLCGPNGSGVVISGDANNGGSLYLKEGTGGTNSVRLKGLTSYSTNRVQSIQDNDGEVALTQINAFDKSGGAISTGTALLTAPQANDYIFSSGVNTNLSCRLIVKANTDNGALAGRSPQIRFEAKNGTAIGHIGLGWYGTSYYPDDLNIVGESRVNIFHGSSGTLMAHTKSDGFEIPSGATFTAGGTSISNNINLGTYLSGYNNSLGRSIYGTTWSRNQYMYFCVSAFAGGSVNGGAYAGYINYLGFQDVSDRKFKTDITYLDSSACLQQTLDLKPCSYSIVSDPDRERGIGFIAQEVIPVVPQVVSEDGTGSYGLGYGHLTATLSGAVQELNKKIVAQQETINSQEERLKNLENIITQLTSSSSFSLFKKNLT